jgi:hypothetical protein
MRLCDARKMWWLSVVVFTLAASIALGVEFAGGTGEPGNPYQIASVEQLIAIGCDPNLWSKHFVLTRDLDMAGVDPNRVRPIGENGGSRVFSGVFDGRDRTVANFRMVRKDGIWVGLFGQIGCPFEREVPPGHVRNLHLRNVTVGGRDVIGGLAAELGAGTISNCSVTGVVVGGQFVGGLVGQVWEGEIISCTTVMEVRGDESVGGLIGSMHSITRRCSSSGRVSGRMCVGGLIGDVSFTRLGTVERTQNRPEPNEFKMVIQCCSDCSVTGEQEVGGLIGLAGWVGGIEDCYALGSVAATAKVGGLIGNAANCGIVRCLSAGRVKGTEHTGGLIGSNKLFGDAQGLDRYPFCQLIVEELTGEESTNGEKYRVVYRPGFVSCFWDPQAAGVTRGLGSGADAQGGVKPLTTTEMRTPGTFRDFGWDFEQVWVVREGRSYPSLRWEQTRPKK